ncbi:porin [Photobacterium toruni]|uniref:porin n=1 Tax=Photobacterium toruni TaxID=1935446 RepID=UPI00210F967C|nr:porin [Photobacterium toruni]
MKKHIIAIAVTTAALALSSGASASTIFSNDALSVDLNGRIEANSILANHDMTATKIGRIGILAQTQITDSGYSALGYIEKDLAVSQDIEKLRYLYVGAGNANNQLMFGKTDSALGLVTDFTDIQNTGSSFADTKLMDREDNQLAYTATFNSLTVETAYKFDGGKSEDHNNKAGGSLAAKYDMGYGVTLGAAYAIKTVDGQSEQRDEQTMLGASYSLDNIYAAIVYQDAIVHDFGPNKHIRGYELATSYALNEQIVLSGSYSYLESVHNGDAAKLIAANEATVNASYYFNPNFRTYAGYTMQIGGQHDNAHNELALGARFDF